VKGKPAKPKAPVRKAPVKVTPKQPGKHPGRGGSPGLHGGPVRKPVLPAHHKVAHRARHHPKRKLALAEGVACCSAEALAASLRLAGHAVSDADVLALYWLTASGAGDGATILATLEAAQEHGLAGVRPAVIHERDVSDEWPGAGLRTQHHRELDAFHVGELNFLDHRSVALLDRDVPLGPARLDGDGRDIGWRDPALVFVHQPIILGLTLPGGEHAVTLDPSGAVWSWGELYRLPGTGIEEAWLVDWEGGEKHGKHHGRQV